MSSFLDRYLSPLRYPGGKAKLAAYIKLLIVENAMVGSDYLELYAGGASVGLSLLLDGYVSRIHLNDIDPGVYAFWHSVVNDCDGLCKLIQERRVSIAEWERQRAIYHDTKERELLERGFATFFLNRTNRSGIIGSGGMIGGRAQKGHWRLNARFNKKELIRRINRIAAESDRIKLYHEDGEQLLRGKLAKLPRKTLIYLDPPYYVKGGRRLYANAYSHDDHVSLARIVSGIRRPWIVSYDSVPAIRRAYSRFRSRRFRLSYTAKSRTVGEEVVFFSPRLKIPRVADLTGSELPTRANIALDQWKANGA